MKKSQKTKCLFYPFLCNVFFEILAKVIKETWDTNREEKNELMLISDCMIIYMKNSKNYIRKSVHLINTFNKMVNHIYQ